LPAPSPPHTFTLSLHDALPIWNLQVPAIAKISAPARDTRVVLAAVPAHAHSLPLLPRGDAGAQFVNDPRDFVSRNARILNTGPRSEEHTSELQSRFDLVCRLLL